VGLRAGPDVRGGWANREKNSSCCRASSLVTILTHNNKLASKTA